MSYLANFLSNAIDPFWGEFYLFTFIIVGAFSIGISVF